MNKYVDFISDEDFLECIKWVCDGYSKVKDFDQDDMNRNTLDPFKILFDIINNNQNIDNWVINERLRQADKTINNRIGEFHQKLLGKVKGWTDLQTGNETKVDLKRENNTIFIELKNKYNTVNSDSLSQVRIKLEKILEKYPNATCYWAYIISKKGDSNERVWIYKGKKDLRIREIWGKEIYRIVTGDRDSLKKVWIALPLAISDLIKKDLNISNVEKKKLLEFFALAFENI